MFSAARWQLFWSRWHASVHWAASHKTKRYARLSGNYTPLSSSKNSSQEVNERTRGTAPLYTSSPQNRTVVCLPLRRQKLSSTPQSLISTKTPRTVSWIIPFDAEPVAATKFSPEKTYIYTFTFLTLLKLPYSALCESESFMFLSVFQTPSLTLLNLLLSSLIKRNGGRHLSVDTLQTNLKKKGDEVFWCFSSQRTQSLKIAASLQSFSQLLLLNEQILRQHVICQGVSIASLSRHN